MDTRSEVRDARSEIRDARSDIRDTRSQIRDTRSEVNRSLEDNSYSASNFILHKPSSSSQDLRVGMENVAHAEVHQYNKVISP